MDANYLFSDFHYLTAGSKIKPRVLRGEFHLLCFALPSPVSSLTRLKFLTARSIMIRFAQVTKKGWELEISGPLQKVGGRSGPGH